MNEEQTCARCGAGGVVEVGETVVGDRLTWSASISCPSCGDDEIECGWDRTPAPWRDLLLRDAGQVTIRAGAETSAPVRARLLAVLRKGGATIAESAASYRALTGTGITGTPAEMELLAARLTSAGAIIMRSRTTA